MPELPFLEEYSGQSTDELLAMEKTHRIDSLLFVFELGIEKRKNRDGIEGLTTEEVIVLAVEGLEREVNNGGYDQFFVNSSAEYASVIVDALRRIGCPEVAAITKDAIAALGAPDLAWDTVEAFIHEDDEERDETLSACDDRYFEYPEDIAGNLFAFIKANRDNVRLPPTRK